MRWGIDEAQAGRSDTAIVHLRQARVSAITALGMDYPSAKGMIQDIEEMLGQFGVTDETAAGGQ